MDKAVQRHILKKRIVLAKRSDEPMTFSERAPRFFKWFEEDVMGFDSEEYRREFWREAYRNGRTIGHVPHTLSDQLRRRGRRSEMVLFDALCISLLMGGAFAIWVMRRRIDLHLHRLRRPSYYETERVRRIGLTEDRRRIRRRTTLNARPTAGQLREAFLHARDSVDNMVRLGSLMEDLECYIDNSLVFGEDGKIIARKGGIRRYIQSEIPDLYKSYKTLMRYKALARRFRQAVGISDPVPAASVLPGEDENTDRGTGVGGSVSKIEKPAENTDKMQGKAKLHWERDVENTVRTNSQRGVGERMGRGGNGGEDGLEGGGDMDMGMDVGCGDCGAMCKRPVHKEAEIKCGNDGAGWKDDEIMRGNGQYEGREAKDATDISGNNVSTGGNGKNHRLDEEVRSVVNAILAVCEGTFLDLAAVLALRICEDAIPHKSYKKTCIGACA